jgi:hypothetical protein
MNGPLVGEWDINTCKYESMGVCITTRILGICIITLVRYGVVIE